MVDYFDVAAFWRVVDVLEGAYFGAGGFGVGSGGVWNVGEAGAAAGVGKGWGWCWVFAGLGHGKRGVLDGVQGQKAGIPLGIGRQFEVHLIPKNFTNIFKTFRFLQN